MRFRLVKRCNMAHSAWLFKIKPISVVTGSYSDNEPKNNLCEDFSITNHVQYILYGEKSQNSQKDL